MGNQNSSLCSYQLKNFRNINGKINEPSLSKITKPQIKFNIETREINTNKYKKERIFTPKNKSKSNEKLSYYLVLYINLSKLIYFKK